MIGIVTIQDIQTSGQDIPLRKIAAQALCRRSLLFCLLAWETCFFRTIMVRTYMGRASIIRTSLTGYFYAACPE